MEHEGKIFQPSESVQFTPEIPLTTFPDLIFSISSTNGILQEATQLCLVTAQKAREEGTLHSLEALQAGLDGILHTPEKLAVFAMLHMSANGQVKKGDATLVIAPNVLHQRPAVAITASKEKKGNEKGHIDISSAFIGNHTNMVSLTGGITIEKDTRVMSSGVQKRRRKVEYLQAGCLDYVNGLPERSSWTNQLTGIAEEFDGLHKQIHSVQRQLAL